MTMYKIFAVFVCILVTAPLSVSAYFTIGQTTTQITDTTALYTIDYYFGSAKHDLYMPIFANRDQVQGSGSVQIGYEILLPNGETRTSRGTTQAFVTSSADVEGDMYKVRKGNAKKFTLNVLMTTEKDFSTDDYRIRVTDLPFYWNGTPRPKLQLNPTELQYYITPEIEVTASK